MPTVNLKKWSVEARQTVQGNPFFLLQDLENSEVYFCFSDSKAWNKLTPGETFEECELEFVENYKGKKISGIIG